jgi:hypothetical protein
MVMYMKLPRYVTVVAALLMLVSACSPIRTITPGLPAVNSPTGEAASSQQPQTGPTQAAVPPTSGLDQPLNSGPATVQVLSPQDGAVVNTPQVQVTGTSSPGSVVSINEVILIVGADGQFTATVPLDEGLNLIEIIASNDSGSETSVELTVTYEP